MRRTWILVANGEQARVLVRQPGIGLSPAVTSYEIDNPCAHVGAGAAPRGAGRAIECDINQFATGLALRLERWAQDDRYDRLVLVAPPRFLVRLRDALGPETRKRIAADMPRDMTAAMPAALSAALSPLWAEDEQRASA